jgi:uncharacterized spore protein YtfJ
MSVPEILRTIGERFQSSATVKNVYGDPISVGDRTVIPVARISYGFGGGGGQGEQAGKGGGGGGGGHMSAVPAGALEITSAGTQFIPFVDWRRLGSVAAFSFALGFVIATRRARS